MKRVKAVLGLVTIMTAVTVPFFAGIADAQPRGVRRARARLDRSDPRFKDGRPYDIYPVKGRKGQKIYLSMTSSSIDPLLILLDQSGNVLFKNDDANGSRNSELVFTFPYSGNYKLIATTASKNRQHGQYEMATTVLNPGASSSTISPSQVLGGAALICFLTGCLNGNGGGYSSGGSSQPDTYYRDTYRPSQPTPSHRPVKPISPFYGNGPRY